MRFLLGSNEICIIIEIFRWKSFPTFRMAWRVQLPAEILRPLWNAQTDSTIHALQPSKASGSAWEFSIKRFYIGLLSCIVQQAAGSKQSRIEMGWKGLDFKADARLREELEKCQLPADLHCTCVCVNSTMRMCIHVTRIIWHRNHFTMNIFFGIYSYMWEYMYIYGHPSETLMKPFFFFSMQRNKNHQPFFYQSFETRLVC